MRAQPSTEKPQWRTTALAFATAVLLGISTTDVHALALGRINVQSALGEPLRAEIEIPEIDADELASLKANIAAPEAFRSAGFDFNPALTGIRISLEKRADGRHFLRLSSQRPINEPFIDLILESTWSSGRILRDYTMLFDPPSLRQGQPLAAELSPSAPATRATPAAAPAAPAAAARAARTAPAEAPRAVAAETPRAPASEGSAKQVTVKGGDTAGRIAAANKPADVSLDQMLVALLRANQDAFVGGNVNRLRSGAVLDVPSAQDAAQIPADEAKQVLVAQSRDFNEFRRRFAESLPVTKVNPADREASGKITAQVEEKQPAATAPDKLTLSKGNAQGKAGAEEQKIARDRAAQDTATRVAELSKNISDLNKIGTAPAAPAASASAAKGGVPVPVGASIAAASTSAPAAAAAAKTPAAIASAPAPVTTPAVVAASSASPASAAAPVAAAAPEAAAPASAAVASASAAAPAAEAASAAAPAAPVIAAAPASAPKPVVKRAEPPPPPEPSLLDDLIENWMLPAGALGAVAALLGGFGFYRLRQRKKSTTVDSSFLESRLQPDSFFGASGGQRIDTNEGNVSGSSLVYSPSQLDAAGDVDPVAEADVYLAYGRDLQAEEILKEAMRTQPQRVAIHAKLLEIYAKRRDARAFELIATEAYGLTHGTGTEWERVCELGQELDPSNSLYRPGGEPGARAVVTPSSAVQTQALAAAPAVEPAADAAPDIDLDLDFSIGDEPLSAPAPVPANEQTQPMQAAVAEPMPSLDMDFGAITPPASAAAPSAVRLDAPDLTLDENALSFDLDTPTAPVAAAAAAAAASPVADAGMIEFDLGALSLDIGTSAKAVDTGPDTEDSLATTAGSPLGAAGFDDMGDDPLSTKLALAREFHSIGDPDGARSLAQEVLTEASGDLKSAAQRLLAEIG
ncbi:hypothetical protein GCM10027034_23680 [Ramlibacter solisilvae]|uniref:FimV N-terminal domain-containing protein n=1 Tax=Ramlibacter tataouinensis TaxID=94132 RepID=A0A127JQ81_9BURK|nr:FimV/HubP family polar landmark protein [Ramlibacter tataouinensis]AMO22075.1 hypothetical protein UC35_03260 [Ramlibacter tataouinensis]